MAKVELKTQKNDQSVDTFLQTISDDEQKADCLAIHRMMQKATGDKGSMWGAAIVGYGSYPYKSSSGREADWMKIGFSPRKGKTTIYIMDGVERYKDQLAKLGTHTASQGSCLYIKHLKDVDIRVLESIISKSYNSKDLMGLN